MRRMRLRVQSATCITCDNNFPHSAAAFKVLLFAADGPFFLSAGILCLLPYEHGVAVAEEPAVVFLALPGVSGLNAAEHLRSLYPKCGIIWCSDLDFSLHAFRLRIEYFFMKPVEEQKIKEGLSIWLECNKIR